MGLSRFIEATPPQKFTASQIVLTNSQKTAIIHVIIGWVSNIQCTFQKTTSYLGTITFASGVVSTMIILFLST